MRRPGALCALFLIFAPIFTALAADAPSVLVQTIAPKKGVLADTIVAYGTAAAAADGSLTLSIPSDGRVMAIAVTPGEAVQAGARLLDFAASATAVSAYQQAKTALALARQQRQHTAQLLSQQLATRDQLAQAEKAVIDATAALSALQQQGSNRPLQSVTAPFDAIVTAIPVASGDRVPPGAALVTLAREDALVVTAGIQPADRARVLPGAPAALDALSGSGRADGQVVRTDSMLNAKSRLVNVLIGKATGLLSGEVYRAVITVGEFHGWLLPRDAVLTDAKGAYVFQVADGKANRVDVTLIGSVGGTTVVEGPLDPAQQLVVAGNYQLSPGIAVRQGNPANP